MEYNKIARAKELLIKTKSRSRKGEQQKNPQNMHAEYHYNPALQNLQCLILGLTDLTLKIWKLKEKIIIIASFVYPKRNL